MYPDGELILLAARKAAIQRTIARHRSACVVAAGPVLRPLLWLDRALGLWRKYSPLALAVAVPLGALLSRSAGPRRSLVGSLLRWGPVAVGLYRRFASPRPRS
jgi:hypothetical protein